MEKVRLGDVCEVLNGYAFKSEKYVDKGIRIIRITNVQKGFIEDKEPQFYPIEKKTEIEKYMLQDDDLLISLTGNVGRVALLEERYLPAALNQRVGCLRIKDKNILKSFLFHCLNSDYFENKCIVSAKGVAQKNMSTEWLKEFKIPLLPVSEQESISNTLDKMDKLISIRKQQLGKLDELVKARFVELFGDPEHNEKKWDVFKLDALCSVSSSKRIYQNELSVEGVPFLRISDLVNRIDTGSTECELYIPEERYEELKTLGLVPIAGDMLITARGTLGRCYTLTENDRFYFQDGMITWLYDFDKSLTTNYLTHLFEMSGFRKQIDSLQAGSTVAYLSISMTKKLNVMLPPLELQNQFTAFVEQTDKSKLEVQKSLEQLETLKKALMQKYFG